MTAAVRDQQLTVFRAVVYNSTSVDGTVRHALVNTLKRTEQNLFVRSGKSEADVTSNNRRLGSTQIYCTIEANF